MGNNYPTKHRNQYPKRSNRSRESNRIAPINRNRYRKGHQNSMTSARRRTVERYRDKTIVTEEEVTIMEFNEDNFEFQFGGQNINKNRRR